MDFCLSELHVDELRRIFFAVICSFWTLTAAMKWMDSDIKKAIHSKGKLFVSTSDINRGDLGVMQET